MSKESHFSFDNLGKEFASSLKFIQYALVCLFVSPTYPQQYYIILFKYVCHSTFAKLHVAILARSSQEISQTVRIDRRSFLSPGRISVPSNKFFYNRKTPKNYRGTKQPGSVHLNEPASNLSKRGSNCVMVDRSLATCRNGDNLNDNCGHSGDRLSQNGEKATSQNVDL